MTITKVHLAKELKRAGISYRQGLECLDVLIEALNEKLINGEKVQLRGFGSFSVFIAPEKKYPSLLSGSGVVPSHGRVLFQPSKELKDAVWNVCERK